VPTPPPGKERDEWKKQNARFNDPVDFRVVSEGEPEFSLEDELSRLEGSDDLLTNSDRTA